MYVKRWRVTSQRLTVVNNDQRKLKIIKNIGGVNISEWWWWFVDGDRVVCTFVYKNNVKYLLRLKRIV